MKRGLTERHKTVFITFIIKNLTEHHEKGKALKKKVHIESSKIPVSICRWTHNCENTSPSWKSIQAFFFFFWIDLTWHHDSDRHSTFPPPSLHLFTAVHMFFCLYPPHYISLFSIQIYFKLRHFAANVWRQNDSTDHVWSDLDAKQKQLKNIHEIKNCDLFLSFTRHQLAQDVTYTFEIRSLTTFWQVTTCLQFLFFALTRKKSMYNILAILSSFPFLSSSAFLCFNSVEYFQETVIHREIGTVCVTQRM